MTMPRTTTFVAMMNIYLILSISPINAFRVSILQEVVTDAADAQELVKEMQKAMQEDAQEQSANQNASTAYFGESWANCEKRQADFERRAIKTNARYAMSKEKAINKLIKDGKDPFDWDGSISAVDAGWVMLKVRSLAKTIAAAKNYKKSFLHPSRPENGCAWVEEKKVDVAPLKELMQSLKPAMTCYAAAQASLEEAQSSENQSGAMLKAMQILTANDCKPHELRETSAEEVNAAEAQIEKSGSESELNLEEALKEQGSSELQTQATSMLQKVSSDIDDVLKKTDTEDANHVELGNALGEIVGKAIAWVMLLFLWVLFCWVLMAVMLVILGLIMCVIKIMIVALIRAFTLNKVKVWDFEYGSCVAWWLGALGHNNDAGASAGLAVCAVGFMTR